VRRHSMACPALPTCGLAVAEAERALPEIVTQVQHVLLQLGIGNEPLSIRMTGCPNGCARPRMGDIGLVGRSLDLYDVFFGGDLQNTRLNTLYAKSVKRQELIRTIRPALELWQQRRLKREPFGDFVTRYGIDNVREAASAEALKLA
jgi:sulfite reductase (ferredoxin)